MRGRLTRIMLIGAAAAVTVMLSAAGALAATWSVHPAGSFTAPLNQGTMILFKDDTSGLTLACPAATAKGDVPKSGHGLAGNGIATISRNTWGTSTRVCTGPLQSMSTAVSTNTPWKFNAAGYNASVDGGQTRGTITASGAGIGFKIASSALGVACSMTIGGSKSAPASASFLYDNKSHLLAITDVTNLKVLSSNCPAVNAGDRERFITTPASKAGSSVTHGYSVSSRIHLTSP